jgi:hypothetical protein
MDTTTSPKSLVSKLAEVMGEIEGRIPKTGRNEFHKYDYATEADIVQSVRAGMAKRKLMLIPSVKSTEWKELGKQRLCTLTVAFTVHDGDSGESMTFDVLGEGTDAGDKATYKALTGATKYALLKLFLIPTGDDPERDDAQPPPQPQARKAADATPPRSAKPQASPKKVTIQDEPKSEEKKAPVMKMGPKELKGVLLSQIATVDLLAALKKAATEKKDPKHAGILALIEEAERDIIAELAERKMSAEQALPATVSHGPTKDADLIPTLKASIEAGKK